MVNDIRYAWKLGAGTRYPISATRVAKELAKIRGQHNGSLKPKHVVEAAKSRKSPLHKLFEWNDSKAAGKYRLVQARYLIGAVITIRHIKQKEIRTRLYVKDIDDRGASVYRDIDSALADKESRARVLDRAIAELESFRLKYAHLSELAAIFKALDGLQVKKRRTSKKKKKKAKRRRR